MHRKSFLLKVIVAVLLCLFTAFFLVDNSIYARYLWGKLRNVANKHGLLIEVKGPELALIGLKASHLRVAAANNPLLELGAKKIRLTTNPISWLTLSIPVTVNSTIYGGEVNAKISYSLLSENISADGEGTKINLSSHPIIKTLGVTSGKFFFNVVGLALEKNQLHFRELTIELAEVEKPQQSYLPKILSGLPLDLQIPPIHSLNFLVNSSLSDDTIIIKKLSSNSSLLNMLGSGKIILSSVGCENRAQTITSPAARDRRSN